MLPDLPGPARRQLRSVGSIVVPVFCRQLLCKISRFEVDLNTSSRSHTGSTQSSL
jgi:hypothetical protein